MKTDRLKTILVISWSAALALGVLSLIVVFYPAGSYQPVVVQATSTMTFNGLSSSSTVLASTSLGLPTTTTSLPPGDYATSYTAPYPVTWTQGDESFSVTGASLQANALTVALSVQVGTTADCVPLNLNLVADESGTMQAPSSPAGPDFIFPDTGTCEGTPGATYSESVSFTLGTAIPSPFLLTTGGTANVFFEAATTTAGGVTITLPSDSG